MENGNGVMRKRWNFSGNDAFKSGGGRTIRGVRTMIMESLNHNDERPTIPLGHGDPSAFPCFHTPVTAVEAVVDAVRSAAFNCYGPAIGILPARRAVAEYLSRDLPYKLCPDDVFLTVGCTQAIDIALKALARPGSNVLVPRPGYPYYESRAELIGIEVRHFNLIPEKGWEIDVNEVGAIADDNTVGMVIINPGNPCGNVYTYQHLEKVAETARKLGIVVISDEVYGHLTFGSNKFIPMGVFGSIAPVVTLGSISKRWMVPGWRLGWLVTSDPHGILQKSGVVKSIKGIFNVSADPATFLQGALPQILQHTKEEFFSKTINLLRQDAHICYEKLNNIPCLTCPTKPEGSMFAMVKLNLSLLDDIQDDIEFCVKLAKEEKVIILPGMAVGLKNWLRVTFAIEPSTLEEALERLSAFCQRHAERH